MMIPVYYKHQRKLVPQTGNACPASNTHTGKNLDLSEEGFRHSSCWGGLGEERGEMRRGGQGLLVFPER
eukprot:2423988-Rhodomonas_salina.1